MHRSPPDPLILALRASLESARRLADVEPALALVLARTLLDGMYVPLLADHPARANHIADIVDMLDEALTEVTM